VAAGCEGRFGRVSSVGIGGHGAPALSGSGFAPLVGVEGPKASGSFLDALGFLESTTEDGGKAKAVRSQMGIP